MPQGSVIVGVGFQSYVWIAALSIVSRKMHSVGRENDEGCFATIRYRSCPRLGSTSLNRRSAPLSRNVQEISRKKKESHGVAV